MMFLRAGGLAVMLAWAGAAGADVRHDVLPWTGAARQQACPTEPSYAWVSHGGGTECIRYFAGGGLDGAPVVIVKLYGDRHDLLRKRPEEIPENTRADQERRAARLTAQAGVPVVIVARPGTYGSSGDLRQRRQAKEFQTLDATLDVLKRRYGIGRFVLLGHSGGATAAAAILTMGRTDIRCAVMSSGAFALIERANLLRYMAGKPGTTLQDTTGLAHPYDPLDHVDRIRADPARLAVIVGDPDDRVTPFVFQRRFGEALKRAGHRVQIDEEPAKPPEHHDFPEALGLRKAVRCAAS